MIELLFISFGSACLSKFLDMCFEQEMIFYSYYRLISVLPVWLFKILGGCIYCFGTWVFICTYLIVYKSVLPNDFVIYALYLVLGIGFNHVFIKAIEKI